MKLLLPLSVAWMVWQVCDLLYRLGWLAGYLEGIR